MTSFHLSKESIQLDQQPDPTLMVRSHPVRPLGQLSNFIVEELPLVIDDVLSGRKSFTFIEERAEALAERTPHPNSLDTPASTNIALLDATLLESAIASVGGLTHHKLATLTSAVARQAGSMPVLTYESLIFRNPPSDPRTFLSGRDGQAELFFYNAHREIEHTCAACIRSLRTLLTSSNMDVQYGNGYESYGHPATEIIDGELTPHVEKIEQIMRELHRQLPLDAFSRLRPFFAENPQRGFPGPSGKFSAGILTLDALACGTRKDMCDFVQRKLREAHLLPSTSVEADTFAGRGDVEDAVRLLTHKKTLSHLRHSHASKALGSSIGKFFDAMCSMRETHIRLLMAFIPNIFRGDGSGTGGEREVKQFVQTPVMIYKQAARDAVHYVPPTFF